jgi:nucleoid-associated protein YgaU
MTIYQGSRYITDPVASPTTSKGGKTPAPVPTLFPKRPTRRNTSIQPRPFHSYVVIQGDRFDILASRFLGSALLWWEIADMNPEIFFPFDDLAPGSVIRIPDSRVASYTVTSQTFVPQVFARVFDAQSLPTS